MQARELWLRSLIRKFNLRWGCELHIGRIIFWSRDYAEYEETAKGKGLIRLNKFKTRAEMAEDLYHELGHAFIHQCGVKRKDLRRFRDASPKISLARFSKLKHVEMRVPPRGFVSWYSQINGTEDFCEVLAALASTDYKCHGTLKYDGYEFDLKKDKVLHKKAKAVLVIISQ